MMPCRRIHRLSTTLFAFAVSLVAGGPVAAQPNETIRTQKATVTLEIVARRLEHPWGLAMLADGRMLVTERPGRLRLVSAQGVLSDPIAGVPKVYAQGQGGLLDIALSPDFATSRVIVMSFAEDRGGGRSATAVMRGRLDDAMTRLDDVAVIFRQQPTHTTNMHYGSRLVFDRTGALFITVGDRWSLSDEAQNPSNHIGKVLRVRLDGTPAADNPGPSGAKSGWAPEIWSIGHRNVQGAALHPFTGRLWTAEHGARGGDEINIPLAGRNYGWPVISYGVHYSGGKIGEGTSKPGMEQPIFYWDPSIAPSGMLFYTGTRYPGWEGSVFVGALAGSVVSRLELDGETVKNEERILGGLGNRYRDVRQGPDGLIYLLTDERDGKVLRLRPAG